MQQRLTLLGCSHFRDAKHLSAQRGAPRRCPRRAVQPRNSPSLLKSTFEKQKCAEGDSSTGAESSLPAISQTEKS